MPPNTVLLLDWDGTCANPLNEITALNETLSYMETLYPRRYQNLPRWPEDKIYDGRHHEHLPGERKEDDHEIAWTYMMTQLLDGFNEVEYARLLPGVRETLERLHRDGFTLAVLSNRYAPSLQKTVEHLGLEDIFTAVEGHIPRTSDFKPGNNNSEGGYEICDSSLTRVINGLREQGTLQDDTVIVMVGDSLSDKRIGERMPGANFAAVTIGDGEVLKDIRKSGKGLTPEEREAAPDADGFVRTDAWVHAPSFDKLPSVLESLVGTVRRKETPSLEVVDKGRKAKASNKPDARQVAYDPTANYLSVQVAETEPSDSVGIDPDAIPEYEHKRSASLPETIIFARYSSNALTGEDGPSDFRIATTGQRLDPGDKLRPIYSANTQLESTVPVVKDMMAQNDFVNQLLERLKASGLQQGETVALCYPWAKESQNKVPIVSANLLEKAIAADPELQALNLKILATPILQSTTDIRDGLTPFQQLAVRPAFNTDILDGRQPVKAICVGENALSVGLTEMAHAVAGKAEIVAIAATSAYDGSEQLTLRPEVHDALVEGIKANTQSQDGKPVKDFENVLKRLGYTNGIASMTNMEAMLILSTLYEPDEGLAHIGRLWSGLNPDETLEQAGEKMHANGMEEHLLMRSCKQGKRSFTHELNRLVEYARDLVPLTVGATRKETVVVKSDTGPVVADADNQNRAAGR